MWQPWRADGFECADTGIGAATGGVAGVCNVRGTSASSELMPHDRELLFWYVVGGRATLQLDGNGDEHLAAGMAVAVPPGMPHRLVDADVLELLEVTLPG